MNSREKYFYTVLFIDDYYRERRYDRIKNGSSGTMENPVQKTIKIYAPCSTNNDSALIKWEKNEDGKDVLRVTHNMKLPLTLEMWDNDGNSIFYCPILKKGIDSISVGQVSIYDDSDRTIQFIFDDETNKAPEDNEVYKLALKTLPSLDAGSERLAADNANLIANEMIGRTQEGLAIVFRRNTLDTHFDLVCEIDDTYIHSGDTSSDAQYLMRATDLQRAKWLTRYTDNLQDILDEINTDYYEIKYSWNNPNSHWQNDPFGYQHQRGHLNN